VARNSREKPSFSEAWILGTGVGEEVDSYMTEGGRVSIRNSSDGQVDYVLHPHEYRLSAEESSVLDHVLSSLKTETPPPGTEADRGYMLSRARASMPPGASMDVKEEERICRLAVRYTVGYGILEALLEDPHVEDVYVDAPCGRNRVHVTVNGVGGFNSVVRCRSNILLEETEMGHVVSRLCQASGLVFSEAQPMMECDMGLSGARATVVGRPLSPAGTALSLRRHSSRPWTLTMMVRNGTMDAEAAALLSLLVDGRSTMMVCGPRGAGKSSVLAAAMFEFPLSQRLLVLEDTRELPVDAMQSSGYKVQSMLADGRGGDRGVHAREALRVSLRMGESALVVGEVRGEEVRTLYEGMRTGRAGSAVMGTMHGESASSVYERVVHDLGVSPEAFMATDVLLCMSLSRPRGTQRMRRRVKELAETGEEPGEFRPLLEDGRWSRGLADSRTVGRIAAAWEMGADEVMENLEARRGMRAFLSDAGAVGDGPLSPHWVRMANDHLSSAMGAGRLCAEEVVSSFAELYRRRSGVL